MPVTFQILKDLPLLHIKCSGTVHFEETSDAAAACAANPDFYPQMPHLFDYSAVTDFDRDYVKFFELQAKLLETYKPGGDASLVVVYAPTPVGQKMFDQLSKTWDPFSHIQARLCEDYDAAFEILGISRSKFEEAILRLT